MAQMSQALGRRPGLVTFAAIMMFLLAGFELTFALVEFWNATWIGLTVYGSFGGRLWLWGILDTVFALVAFYAGFDILRGGGYGLTGRHPHRHLQCDPVVFLSTLCSLDSSGHHRD